METSTIASQVDAGLARCADVALVRECDVARYVEIVCQLMGGFSGGPNPPAALNILYADGVPAAQRLDQLQRWAAERETVSLRSFFTAQCRVPPSDFVINLRKRRFAVSNRALDAVHVGEEQVSRCRTSAREQEGGRHGCLEALEPDAPARLRSSPTHAGN